MSDQETKFTVKVHFSGGPANTSAEITWLNGGINLVMDKVNEPVHNSFMKLTDLERRIIADLSSGNFRFSYHATQRSNERRISRDDIRHAAQEWVECNVDEEGKVHLFGPDNFGDEIEVVAVYDVGTLVITIIGMD